MTSIKQSTTNYIKEELSKLNECRKIIDESWKREVELYEHGAKQDYNLIQINPRIFPYHKQCVPLLDMYTGLDEPFEYDLLIEDKDIPGWHNRHLVDAIEPIQVDEYLPCSAKAIMTTFFPFYQSQSYSDDNFDDIKHETSNNSFEFLEKWEDRIWKEKEEWIHECYKYSTYNEAMEVKNEKSNTQIDNHKPMIDYMPKGMRTKILLKLLKHSMSELQRDHRLARAVILSMIQNNCFDGDGGVEALRYVLMTFISEYIQCCNGRCHLDYMINRTNDDDPRPSHYCSDYGRSIKIIRLVIANGIELMSKEHSNVLVSFVHYLYDQCGWKEDESMVDLIGYDDDESIQHFDKPIRLLHQIIAGIGMKAFEDRNRLKTLLRWKYSTSTSADPSLLKEIDSIAKSHQLSMEALNRIAKTTLIRIPHDSITETIGSNLVRCFVLNSMDRFQHSLFRRQYGYNNRERSTNPLYGIPFDKDNFEIMTKENRYADSINNEFTMKKRRLNDIKEDFLDSCCLDEIEQDPIIQTIFLSGPSQEVQNIVKALFLSQIVDPQYSCGYGDFLVWCRLPVHIHDPMLYEHLANFPDYDDEVDFDDNGEEDITRRQLEFYDEEQNLLRGGKLQARYDFSLLLLKRVWAAPWNPKNHASFQTQFRDAVWTLLLCAHRYHLGSDIPLHVCSYLSRHWWPDGRICCWQFECEIDKIEKLIFNNMDRKCKSMIACDGCRTAHACSENHLASIHMDGHRRVCKIPPIREFNNEDEMFCREVLNENICERMEEEEEDDASCWESIGSDEVNTMGNSKTDQIYRYFRNESWR